MAAMIHRQSAALRLTQLRGALASLIWLAGFACLLNPTAARSAEPIRIGAVLPFSGGVELYGGQAKLGIDLAVREINAGGGILRRPVEVIYEDDETNPSAAEDATRKLIERSEPRGLNGASRSLSIKRGASR